MAITLDGTNGITTPDLNATGEINADIISNEAGTGAPNFPNGLSVNSNPLPTAGSLSNRNRIINGDMRIDQRNAGAAVTFNTAATYLVDRWTQNNGGGATITGQQSTTAPSGFTNSLLVTATTGGAPSAGQARLFRQIIEGFNIADLGWGSASAQPITVSFWVRSSATGVFCCYVTNASYNRSQVQTFNITSAGTWEYKTVTFSGDTSGTWGTGNGPGIEFGLDVGSGSNFEATVGAWNSGWYIRTAGAVILSATTNANIYLTGVQLEVGDTATPFEHRSYGQELALCQRYYQNTDDGSNTVGLAGNVTSGLNYHMPIRFPVAMRAAPTMTYIPWTHLAFGATVNFQRTGKFGTNAYATANATNTAGYWFGAYTASAEL